MTLKALACIAVIGVALGACASGGNDVLTLTGSSSGGTINLGGGTDTIALNAGTYSFAASFVAGPALVGTLTNVPTTSIDLVKK